MGTIGYRPAIDGLRAIAVLAVVAYHAGLPVPAGFVGVDVFFVISGYLITRLLLDEVQATGRIDFIGFYARRGRRILPAVIAVMIATLAAGASLLPPLEAMQASKAAAAAFVSAANIYFALAPTGYFDGDAQSNPLLHLWSLGVEEQFYLAWPVVLLVVRRRPAVALWGIALTSFVAAEALLGTGHDQAAFFQTPARAWELAIGGLIAVHRPKVPAWVGHTGLAIVVLACAIGVDHFPGFGAVPAVVGAAMVIATAAAGHRLSILEARPLVWIGLVSYSLYLWHWPVMVLGDLMPTWSQLALSFLLAAGSYRFVEQPFRRTLVAAPRTTVVASGAAICLGLIGGLAMVSHYTSIEAHGQQLFSAVAESQAPSTKGCDQWFHSDELTPCTFGSATAPKTAVIVGDSVAMQWFGAAHLIFDRPDWRLVALTKSGCPMVESPIVLKRTGKPYAECAVWRTRVLEWMARQRPDVVIVGSSNGYPFTPGQWLSGTRHVIHRLANAAGTVVLLRSTPQRIPGSNDPHDDVHEWQRQAIADIDNARAIDMNPYVCPRGKCPREINGVTTYRDNRHLTPVFVESLSAQLRNEMRLDLTNGQRGASARDRDHPDVRAVVGE